MPIFIMARWKYTIILTVAAYILLSILDKHLKCNMSSIISSVVSLLSFTALLTLYDPMHTAFFTLQYL